MKTSLAQKAINFAMSGEWEKAKELNLLIVSEDINDIDALNRLARCYWELGDTKKAKKTVRQVLSLEPSNSIALKCLTKYGQANTSKKRNADTKTYTDFIEESGKTRIVELSNLGDKNVISCLCIGESVKMLCHTHKVSVATEENKYIGKLTDDIASRLRLLMKSGNKYATYIKSVTEDNVSVFIKEVERKTENPSFPPEKIDYVAYTPPELVHKIRVEENSES